MDKKIKIIARCDDVNGAEVNIEAHGVGADELMARVTMTMVALSESLTEEYGEAATMATAEAALKAVNERHGRNVLNVVVAVKKHGDDPDVDVLVYDKIENRYAATAMKTCAVYKLLKEIEAESGMTRRELLEVFEQEEAKEDPSERIMKEAAGHDGDHDA